MNLRKSFNFKTREILTYIAHYDNDNECDVINSVDIYLSNGQVINLDLKNENITKDDLYESFDFDEEYWGTIYCKDNGITTIKSEVKSKTTEYNPYG